MLRIAGGIGPAVVAARSGVWRMNKDGSGLVHLVDGGPFAIAGDSLYFFHDAALWRMCK